MAIRNYTASSYQSPPPPSIAPVPFARVSLATKPLQQVAPGELPRQPLPNPVPTTNNSADPMNTLWLLAFVAIIYFVVK